MSLSLPGSGALALPSGTTIGANPAQFDNSQQAATTAFVQAALGNMAGYGGLINANTAIAAAGIGRFYSVSGAITVSLPTPMAALAGATIELIGIDAANNYTVNVTGGSNLVGYSLLNAPSLVCNAGAPHVFRCNGTNWYVVAGAERYRSDFGASLGANGWQKLPSGLIQQWGYVVATSGGAVVSYPIAFPTKVVSLTFGSQAAASSNVWSNAEVSTNNKTGFTLYSSTASSQSSFAALGY